MIDINSWPLNMQLFFASFPFLLIFIGLAISLHIACSRDFYIMLAAIQSSPWIERQKRSWGTTSLKARWALVWSVCGLVVFPYLHLRRGVVDADEIRNFPPALKRKMLISLWPSAIGFCWMLVGGGLVRLSST